MCYKIKTDATPEALTKKYNAKILQPELLKPHYNLTGFYPNLIPITDYAKLPVLTAHDRDSFTFMQWGLLPSWTTKEKAKIYATNNLNARAETIFELKSFAPALMKNNRCIIPVTGFYESREVNKVKYPYFIHLKCDNIFSLAGIFESWLDNETGITIKSFAIITTQANPLMEKIHNKGLRMPAILTKDLEFEWLKPELKEEEAQRLLTPCDDAIMEAYTVDKKINNTYIDSDIPEISMKVEYPEIGMFN